MPISKPDQLFRLIKSLTKAEKRNFKLYVKRIQKGEESIKFLDLFEILDKQDAYSESQTLIGLKEKSKTKFANSRRHLYQHLLTSLRLMHMSKEAGIQIREQIDYAHILYGKGFYLEALKLLDMAKRKARVNNLDLPHLETIEFEKKIESRHITRSSTERIEGLIEESRNRNQVISNTISLSNLKLFLQRYFINSGHVKNEEERALVAKRFKSLLPLKEKNGASFFEKIYQYEAFYWYHYILLELEDCHMYAQNWVRLYEKRPKMIEEDVDMYLRGVHHLLTTSWFNQDWLRFDQTLSTLQSYVGQKLNQFNPNSQTLARFYLLQWQLNHLLINKQYREGLQQIPKALETIEELKKILDPHKIFILYYKIACLYMGGGEPDRALTYLNDIINQRSGRLRKDIQCYARLLLVMAHYQLNNFELIESLLRSTGRFILKMRKPNPIPEILLHFFREKMKNPLESDDKNQNKVIEQLTNLKASPYQRRAFIYLDISSWLNIQKEKSGRRETAKKKRR